MVQIPPPARQRSIVIQRFNTERYLPLQVCRQPLARQQEIDHTIACIGAKPELKVILSAWIESHR